MFSKPIILIFAAFYTLALVLEVSRFTFRSRIRGLLTVALLAIGLVSHSFFLYQRATATLERGGAPLSSGLAWFLIAAWVLVVIDLYLTAMHPKTPFGLFLLPLSLAMIATAGLWAPDQPLPREPASRAWGAIHGMALVLATVAVLVGFVSGLMYFFQVRRLKKKRPPSGGLHLPSLEWLQRANARAMRASVLMLGLGLMAGEILDRIRVVQPDQELGWRDPVVWSTWLLFFWLLTAVILSAFYPPARTGRKVALLTLASFVFLVIMLAIGVLTENRHWERRRVSLQQSTVSVRRSAIIFPLSAFRPPLSGLPGGPPC
jgi:ABC-type uncharacterized transport system permease subunit